LPTRIGKQEILVKVNIAANINHLVKVSAEEVIIAKSKEPRSEGKPGTLTGARLIRMTPGGRGRGDPGQRVRKGKGNFVIALHPWYARKMTAGMCTRVRRNIDNVTL
jgi:hypothetical protein